MMRHLKLLGLALGFALFAGTALAQDQTGPEAGTGSAADPAGTPSVIGLLRSLTSSALLNAMGLPGDFPWDFVRPSASLIAIEKAKALRANRPAQSQIQPLSAPAIAPVSSPATEGSRTFCSGPCNLWSLYVTTGATAGFLMTFNQQTVPADGAVTPVECVVIAPNQTGGIDFSPGPPDLYRQGMTAVFSSTGCFTKTASATAFFKARVM